MAVKCCLAAAVKNHVISQHHRALYSHSMMSCTEMKAAELSCHLLATVNSLIAIYSSTQQPHYRVPAIVLPTYSSSLYINYN